MKPNKKVRSRHNKIRNTGLLFEFIMRQVTVDVLEKKDNSKALDIIKKRFNERTELGKERALYTLLATRKFNSDKKAEYFISEVLNARKELNISQLKRGVNGNL